MFLQLSLEHVHNILAEKFWYNASSAGITSSQPSPLRRHRTWWLLSDSSPMLRRSHLPILVSSCDICCLFLCSYITHPWDLYHLYVHTATIYLCWKYDHVDTIVQLLGLPGAYVSQWCRRSIQLAWHMLLNSTPKIFAYDMLLLSKLQSESTMDSQV